MTRLGWMQAWWKTNLGRRRLGGNKRKEGWLVDPPRQQEARAKGKQHAHPANEEGERGRAKPVLGSCSFPFPPSFLLSLLDPSNALSLALLSTLHFLQRHHRLSPARPLCIFALPPPLQHIHSSSWRNAKSHQQLRTSTSSGYGPGTPTRGTKRPPPTHSTPAASSLRGCPW